MCSARVIIHILYISFIFFFFSSRRRHTRSKRDWSSDVCSSDLTEYRQQVVGIELSDETYCQFVIVEVEQHSLEMRLQDFARSEERRVGKECRSRWSPEQ